MTATLEITGSCFYIDCEGITVRLGHSGLIVMATGGGAGILDGRLF